MNGKRQMYIYSRAPAKKVGPSNVLAHQLASYEVQLRYVSFYFQLFCFESSL